MSVLAIRFRYFANISTLTITTLCFKTRPLTAKILYTEIDVPVQVYIEDKIRDVLKRDSVRTVSRHIELVSEKIALDFLKDFDFDTSVFHQQEKNVRSAIWQPPRKPRILQLHPA